MYSKDRKYKFQTSEGIYYTGKIIEEDDINVKIKTIRDETIILNKKYISRSTELE